MSGISDNLDDCTKFTEYKEYKTFKLQYVLQFSEIYSIIIVRMIKTIIVQLHSLEHTTPASREWEQALPKLELLLLHSVRLCSLPVQYTLEYHEGPLPAPK